MGAIKRTQAFLTINDTHLARNFRFKVIRTSNSLVVSASVYIKQNYFLANRMEVQKDDKLYLSIQNNSEDKVLIFSGTVDSVSSTNSEVHILAEYRTAESEDFNETYKDTKISKALSVLAPNLKYDAADYELPHIVLQGTHTKHTNANL